MYENLVKKKHGKKANLAEIILNLLQIMFLPKSDRFEHLHRALQATVLNIISKGYGNIPITDMRSCCEREWAHHDHPKITRSYPSHII